MNQPLLPNHLNTITGADKISIRDTYASGVTERWATLNEFDQLQYFLSDATLPKKRVLEATFDLTALGANELILHTFEEAVISIDTVQLYVSETITKSGGSNIDHVSVGLDSNIEAIGHTEGLTAGEEINTLTPAEVPTGTELKMFGAKSDHAAGSGTITGGEIKVRITYTYMDAISDNYETIL